MNLLNISQRKQRCGSRMPPMLVALFLCSLVVVFVECPASIFAQNSNQSRESLEKRLKQYELEQRHDTLMVQLLIDIGAAYLLQNPDKSIKFQQRALEMAQQIDYGNGERRAYLNIGNAYGTKGFLDKASEYYFKSLTTAERYSDKSGIAKALNNIGLVYSAQKKLLLH